MSCLSVLSQLWPQVTGFPSLLVAELLLPPPPGQRPILQELLRLPRVSVKPLPLSPVSHEAESGGVPAIPQNTTKENRGCRGGAELPGRGGGREGAQARVGEGGGGNKQQNCTFFLKFVEKNIVLFYKTFQT